jgi:predicted nucleic acid-binding protein
MNLVADASVALKWVFHDAPGETDAGAALASLDGVRKGAVDLLQPPHWILEIAAVVAFKITPRANEVMADIRALPYVTVESSNVLERAIEMSARFKHHLFDTLYHAVALEHGATLVTADDAYFAALETLSCSLTTQRTRPIDLTRTAAPEEARARGKEEH